MDRKLLVALVAAIALVAAALPASASALAPSALTGLDCVDDNDLAAAQDICPVSTDGLAAPSAFAVSPDGRDVYVSTSADDAVVHLRRGTNGTLTPAECIDDNDAPGGPDACALSTDGLHAASDVAVTPDGRNVLAVSEVDSALVNLDRDPATGVLTPAGCVIDNDTPQDTCAQSTNGLAAPEGVAISPDGRDVYVASFGDEAISQIRRDPVTGVLTPGGCVDDNDTGPEACATSVDGLNETFDRRRSRACERQRRLHRGCRLPAGDVTLTPVVDGDARSVSWDRPDCKPTECRFRLHDDATVTATFTPRDFPRPPHGGRRRDQVRRRPLPGELSHGTTVSLQAREGSDVFRSWARLRQSDGTTCTVVMTEARSWTASSRSPPHGRDKRRRWPRHRRRARLLHRLRVRAGNGGPAQGDLQERRPRVALDGVDCDADVCELQCQKDTDSPRRSRRAHRTSTRASRATGSPRATADPAGASTRTEARCG